MNTLSYVKLLDYILTLLCRCSVDFGNDGDPTNLLERYWARIEVRCEGKESNIAVEQVVCVTSELACLETISTVQICCDS